MLAITERATPEIFPAASADHRWLSFSVEDLAGVATFLAENVRAGRTHIDDAARALFSWTDGDVTALESAGRVLGARELATEAGALVRHTIALLAPPRFVAR